MQNLVVFSFPGRFLTDHNITDLREVSSSSASLTRLIGLDLAFVARHSLVRDQTKGI